LKHLAQPPVDLGAVSESHEQTVLFDAPVFADAEKDNTVDGTLYGEVQFTLCKAGIPEGDISGKYFAPSLNFFEEGSVNFGGSPLYPAGFNIFIKRTFKNRFTREDRGDFIPAFDIFIISKVKGTCPGRLVGLDWFNPAVIDGEFLKIRQDTERQLGRPCVTAKLVCGIDLFPDINGGFLRFQKEFACSADTEAVIRGLCGAAYFNGIFMYYVLICLSIALFVIDIPTEGMEEGVDKFLSNLGLVVPA